MGALLAQNHPTTEAIKIRWKSAGTGMSTPNPIVEIKHGLPAKCFTCIVLSRISSHEELRIEGVTLLAQHVAEGSFGKKYPLMNTSISSLSLVQMEALVTKYRCMVLSYEILQEASMHKDSSTIIR